MSYLPSIAAHTRRLLAGEVEKMLTYLPSPAAEMTYMPSIAAHTNPLATTPDLEAQVLIAAVADTTAMSNEELLAAATNLDAYIIEQASQRANVRHEMDNLPLSAPSEDTTSGSSMPQKSAGRKPPAARKPKAPASKDPLAIDMHGQTPIAAGQKRNRRAKIVFGAAGEEPENEPEAGPSQQPAPKKRGRPAGKPANSAAPAAPDTANEPAIKQENTPDPAPPAPKATRKRAREPETAPEAGPSEQPKPTKRARSAAKGAQTPAVAPEVAREATPEQSEGRPKRARKPTKRFDAEPPVAANVSRKRTREPEVVEEGSEGEQPVAKKRGATPVGRAKSVSVKVEGAEKKKSRSERMKEVWAQRKAAKEKAKGK